MIETGSELEFYAEYLELNDQIPVFLQPEWNQRDRTLPLVLELLKKFHSTIGYQSKFINGYKFLNLKLFCFRSKILFIYQFVIRNS